MAQTQPDVDRILQEARDSAREVPLSYKKVAIETAGRLDNSNPSAVTSALYDRLKAEGSDGLMSVIVTIIARTTQAFSPDVWLPLVAAEGDPFVRERALGIFANTRYKTDERFLTLIKDSLKDTRVGRRLVGEERAYSDVGSRVCDVAYNILMQERTDKPPEYPLDVSNDSIEKRNMLITKLCIELGVPGPTSTEAIRPNVPPDAIPSNTQRPSDIKPPLVVTHETAPSESNSIFGWLFAASAILGGLWWLMRKKRK